MSARILNLCTHLRISFWAPKNPKRDPREGTGKAAEIRCQISASTSVKIGCQPFCSGLWPILSARVVHEVSRTEELAERRRTHSADNAGFEVEEHRAWCVFAARGLVVKHVDAVELRVVVAAVLAAVADAVLVAQHVGYR